MRCLMDSYDDIVKYLYNHKDDKYKAFNDRIVNTKYQTLGVRVPVIKSLAKEISKQDISFFINYTSLKTYEEVLLKGFVVTLIKDKNKFYDYLDDYLDLIDCWSLCDSVCANAKILKKDEEMALFLVKKNIVSDNPWRVRFAFITMLDYLVSLDNLKLIFKYLDEIKSDFYYVKMAKAWLLCECFIKFQKETYKYLLDNKLDDETLKMTISKIKDSYRVTKDVKKRLLLHTL